MLNNAAQRCQQKEHLGRKTKKQTISGCNRLCVVLSAKEQLIYMSLVDYARVTRFTPRMPSANNRNSRRDAVAPLYPTLLNRKSRPKNVQSNFCALLDYS